MKECNTIKQSPLAGIAAYGGGAGSVIFGRKGVGGYQIERSLRFNSADNTYLSRTPSSATNRRTFTFSAWVKKAEIISSGDRQIFGSDSSGGGEFNGIAFVSTNALNFRFNDSGGVQIRTTNLFRDPGAWLHIVCTADTTQATASNRLKIYVNGAQVTDFSTSTYPSQNAESSINSTQVHEIGRRAEDGGQYFNGYLADVHFIDGTALDPSSFGETNDDGIWDPKEFNGSFGTNGFHLKFDDASTKAALGTDSSGNSNTFTVNNLSNFDGTVALATGALPILNTTGNYGETVGSGTRTDSSSSSIVLALPLNGANNGTTWSDESATIKGSGSAKTITRNNDPITSTTESFFYGSSTYFDGNGDRLVLGNASDLSFTGDFTVETWLYLPDSSTIGYPNGDRQIIGVWTGSTNDWLMTYSGTGSHNTFLFQIDAGGGTVFFSSGVNMSNYVGQWVHLATVRNSGSIQNYVNGVASGSAYSNSSSFGQSSNVSVGGRVGGDANSVKGYLSDTRIYLSAKYTGNFDPPSRSLGSNCDSLFDSPVDGTQTDTGAGGEVSGNYATLNPLAPSGLTLSNGNLDGSGSVIQGHAPSTIFASSGKFYCEFTLTTYQNDTGVGVAASIANPGEDWIGEQPYTVGYLADGRLFQNSSSTSYSSYAAGDVIGAAFDVATGKVWFHKNGTYLNSGNPAAGTGQVGTITGGYDLGFTFRSVGGAGSFNFGQRPFAYTAPSGFKALCTTNLPTPAIADGSDNFDTSLWTGNGGTQSITGLEFSPDLVWIKMRSAAAGHRLYDTTRGATKYLVPQGNDAEATQSAGLTSFDSAGFSLGSNFDHNNNNSTFVGWTWSAGANSNKTYTVKVVSDSGNKYRFDDFGTSAVTLDLEEGSTYVFDQSDSSNSGHPLRFSTTSDGTHGGGSEYTTGVTTTGTPGSAGAKTTIVVAASAPTLYYYCSNHSGMGGQADTNSTAGASNFDGSIQATVKANQTAGFSIATISSATGSTTADLGHGLNAQPHFIIQKSRTNTYSWQVYHIASGSYKYGNLNGTGVLSSANTGNMGITPNNSTVGLGSDFTGSNNYVYYCFAPVAGYSAFGEYTGNGSSDGPFVHTGFRPALVLTKCSSDGGNWQIIDGTRSPYNLADKKLWPSQAYEENSSTLGGASADNIDIVSNGFKLSTSNNGTNGSSRTYIYAAFAENPFKTARAR